MARRRKFSRVRRGFSRIRHSRRGSRMMGGVMGDVLSGAVVGGALTFGGPMISSFVPPLMGMRPTTIAALGGGIVAKGVLHKGGRFADAAIIIGTAMAIQDFTGGTSAGGGMVFY